LEKYTFLGGFMAYIKKSKIHRKCELEDCGVWFDTSNMEKKYCCKKHKDKSRYYNDGEYVKKGKTYIEAKCPKCERRHMVNGRTHTKYTFCRFCRIVADWTYEPVACTIHAPERGL
jgi:hypothetical protein